MTIPYRRRGFLALLAGLALAAAPLAAQDTAAVKALAQRDSIDAQKAYNASRSSTVRAAARRIQARTDSIAHALRVVVAPPAPTPAPVDTARDSVIVTPGPGPGPVLFTHPFAPPANGALLATLPRDTVDASYPAITRRVSCTNLQACLDTAKTGDEIRLAKGASFTDVVVKPTPRGFWAVVRTDVTDVELGGPWERMTPAKADALNLATIRSSGTSVPAITVASSAHHVRFVGVRVSTSAPQTNALVRIGLGESDSTLLPHHITLDRVVIDPGANDLRRCVVLDGARLAVLSSTLANCHSKLGDAQGILSINGRGPFRIENNAIQGSHQAIMFGGGDPAIRGQVPADVVIRRNDLSRPLAWRSGTPGTYSATQWPGKTALEWKIGKRMLVEGNVLCHTWPDNQTGYAVLAKTENQDGGTSGDWSETADLTIRYNRLCGAGGAFNLSALAAGPGVPMARVAIYGNEADSVGIGPYQGDTGDALQLAGVSDLVFQDNWTRNPLGRSCVYSLNVSARAVIRNNVCGGQYGIRGEGGLAYTLPGAILTANTVEAWGTAFTSWPVVPSDSVRAALLNGVVVP